MARLTVLHNRGEAIPIIRSWSQVAIRTCNVGPSSGNEMSLDNDDASSSNSTAYMKILRMSSTGKRRSGEARKFLRWRR